MSRPTRARWGAAFAWGAIAGAVSYPAQRLVSAWSGELAYGEILAQEHVPYTWRLLLTALHAVLVGSIAGLGTDEAGADRLLAAVPWAIPVVAALALAMALVP